MAWLQSGPLVVSKVATPLVGVIIPVKPIYVLDLHYNNLVTGTHQRTVVGVLASGVKPSKGFFPSLASLNSPDRVDSMSRGLPRI